MNQITIFLTFNGNCKEAMRFYQRCLGGELSFQALGDTPQSAEFPKAMKEFIVHASLKKENMVLMGTDMIDGQLSRGNSVSILLECNSEKDLRKYYKSLSASGAATQPITRTYWGALSGGLTDQYGIQWLLRSGSRAVPEQIH